MTETIYDLLVIGGGINGAAVARDAAGRSLRVLLCEKDDLAAHTSSASTKLIHGGLRYLEHGAFRLVREALREREVLLRAAPHLVWPQTFILPYHKGLRPAWMLRLGLWLYDALAGGGRLPKSARVALAGGPLKADYRFGFRYSDCAVDDSRLVVLTAMDAQARGAAIRTRTECVELQREGETWIATLRPDGGAPLTVRARALVNAAGPWAEGIGRRIAPGAKDRLRLVKGSHIVTRRLYDGDDAYIFQNADGRIVFAIPYRDDYTLIGTTDVPVETPEEGAAITQQEIDYLCAAASEYFTRAVTPGDVVWTYAGVRALYDDGDANPSRVSRDDALILDTDGAPALSIYGGKLTTHRRVAERALAKLAPHLEMSGPWTADAVLPGGDFAGGPDALAARLAADYPWAPEAMLQRMARAYGTRTRAVLGEARAPADLGRHFGADLYARELTYMMTHEFARTGEDALWRRSRLGLVLSDVEQRAAEEWMRAQ